MKSGSRGWIDMKCKICGGELSFESGVAVCKSCNTQQKIDYVFEDSDVMICYIENDSNGRRTKDSLIAQELYQKLKATKINAFYERVSASDAIGDEIEQLRYMAIYNAKVVIIVGTSAENFNAVLEKYGKYFSDKVVVPVVADISPSDIPKDLSKYQALSYSSIGWEKDLQKAVLRILGREKEIDLLETHNKSKKLRIVIISSLIAVVLIVAGVLLFLHLNNSNSKEDTSDVSTTVAPLTNQQIYENAQSLVVEGKYLEAVELYLQILDYKDSEKQIKKIYDRYDGYYQDEKSNCSLYINIIEAKTVEFSFEKTINQKIVKAEDVLTLDNNQIVGTYIDNFLNEGKISISLSNEHISLSVTTEVKSDDLCFGNVNIQFNLSDKSDRPPIKAVTKELLLSWVESLTYVDDIKAAGYELEYIDTTGPYDSRFGIQYKIANTDVIIVTTNLDLTKYNENNNSTDQYLLDKYAVAAIIAPAEIICSEKIGNNGCAFTEKGIAYIPNVVYLLGPTENSVHWENLHFTLEYYESINSADKTKDLLYISGDTLIGVVSEKRLSQETYTKIVSSSERTFLLYMAEEEAKRRFVQETDKPITRNIVVENDTYILLALQSEQHKEECTCAWYKVDLKQKSVSFVREGTYREQYGKISESLWFSEYLDFAKEFPELFGVTPGSDEWDDLVIDDIYDKVYDDICKRYPRDDGSVSYGVPAENDTHILIPASSQTLKDAGMCAWYKCSKTDGSVKFLKEDIYVENGHTITKYLWFKEYSDFAKEFPSLYGDPDSVDIPYLSTKPFTVKINGEHCWLYTAPSVDSDVVEDDGGWSVSLSDGTYTIVEVKPDEYYRPWGKLESGEGWICISDIY